MSIADEQISPFNQTEEARLIDAAQWGCRKSLNQLMEAYEPAIEAHIGRHGSGGLDKAEAQQVGREALWQAILDYPLDSPERLWSLHWGMGAVGCAILSVGKWEEWRRRRASWRLTGLSDDLTWPDPAQIWDAVQIQAVLDEMLARLPERLQQVMVAYYGLDGQRPATYRQIGPQMGYSHASIWLWQHEALARLSHPSHSYRLRSLLGRQSLADYLKAKRRTHRWLRRRGGRGAAVSNAA